MCENDLKDFIYKFLQKTHEFEYEILETLKTIRLFFLAITLSLNDTLKKRKVTTMIDTIVLTLTSDQFKLTAPEKFKPSAQWASNPAGAPHGITSKQNPTPKELSAGIYKPRLTLAR